VLLNKGYSLNSKLIAKYLITLKYLTRIDPLDFREFKNRAFNYIVKSKHLYYKIRHTISKALVLN
jgi:hypothetical protein